MDEPAAAQPDDIDGLLHPQKPAGGADPLRSSLRMRTTAVLRRRRRLKRVGMAGALAACYVAGMMTMRPWTGPATNPAPDGLATRPATKKEVKRTPVRRPNSGQEKRPEVAPPAAVSALALEWQALDHPERRAQLYRQAGDRYLQDNNVSAALRCYRGALAAGPEKDWNISVNDNWLLMAAKKERQRENADAENGG